MANPFPLSATTKLVLEHSSVGTCVLKAEVTTLDGTVTATYEDFQSAFSVNQKTWEFDLSKREPRWYGGTLKHLTRVTEQNILVATYHPDSGPPIERRLNLAAFVTVRGNKLEFNGWYGPAPILTHAQDKSTGAN
jgi:hypothetical protein